MLIKFAGTASDMKSGRVKADDSGCCIDPCAGVMTSDFNNRFLGEDIGKRPTVSFSKTEQTEVVEDRALQSL
jgi:hypothetical protein